MFRVAKKKFGPFNPPMRDPGTAAEELSRWDTPGRTIYGGATETAAYIEVLSYIAPAENRTGTMSDFFDDVGYDDELFLYDQIGKELPRYGAMPPRSVSRGWRDARNIYEFRLPEDGWFVDITASDSIGSVAKSLRDDLEAFGIEELQLSHLTADGPDARVLTTHVADYVRGLVLDDGSLPHGIVYPSKYGSDLKNFAVWLRRGDDGTGSPHHPLQIVDNDAIHLHAVSFQKAVQRLSLTAH